MTRVGFVSIVAAVAAAGDPASPPVELELVAPSLCEASAAVGAPWDAGLILVADNEIDDRLFAFAVEDDRLAFRSLVPLQGGSRSRDVEALAAWGGGVVVIGSHGDSKRGEIKPKRSRLGFYGPPSAEGALQPVRSLDNAAIMAAARREVSECVALLFTVPLPGSARELCSAWGREPPQFEGAVTLPGDGQEAPRLWLGLRAPLLGGRALLLRLQDGAGAFRFDGIASIDLGGLGIRELALRGDRLLGIAGPADDRPGRFRLFDMPLPQATGEDAHPVRWLGELPTNSEGLVPVRGGVIALLDVNRPGGGDSACPGSARQAFLPLAPPAAGEGTSARME